MVAIPPSGVPTWRLVCSMQLSSEKPPRACRIVPVYRLKRLPDCRRPRLRSCLATPRSGDSVRLESGRPRWRADRMCNRADVAARESSRARSRGPSVLTGTQDHTPDGMASGLTRRGVLSGAAALGVGAGLDHILAKNPHQTAAKQPGAESSESAVPFY